jgi:uncharacterized iron-regulated membrane protein
VSGFRQSQSSLHTWAGLIVGWVLFSIFLAGTISYWREDVNRWMRPELGSVESPDRLVTGAMRFLGRTVPDAEAWYIAVPERAASATDVFWQPQPVKGEAPRRGRRRDTQSLVGPDGERVSVRETRGGDFLYRFHFDLHYVPVIWARWFVGFCAMMMLIAIVSGVITHKKIFVDFFTLRRAKGQRSWLDGHNALAVLALPFHLMITYTGLVTLMTLYMPWAAVANYKAPAALFETLAPSAGRVERSGTPAPLVDPVPLLRDATLRWGGAAVGLVQIELPGDAQARITLTAAPSSGVSARRRSLTYSGATGRLIWRSPDTGPGAQTAGVLVGLHAGRYAPDALRWLYFLSGIGGTLMVASGLVLWTVKRREKLPDPQRPHFGFRLVERLNIGFVAGFPLAITGYFWANRLLPVALRSRADAEINALFLTWAAALACAFLLPARKAWVGLLALCGGALALLPLWSPLGPRGLVGAAVEGDLRMIAMNLMLLLIGAAFIAIARKVARYRPKARRSARRPAAASPEPALLEAAE